MAICSACKGDVFRIRLIQGVCVPCIEKAEAAASEAARIAEKSEAAFTAAEAAKIEAAAQNILLTTETAHNLHVERRLDIVTAEIVIGLHLFKDIAAAFRDTFGGRSKTMEDGLRDARKAALRELRHEALGLGADAVVGVSLNYSEVSGGGKSMLFLVASGTAVTLRPVPTSLQ